LALLAVLAPVGLTNCSSSEKSNPAGVGGSGNEGGGGSQGGTSASGSTVFSLLAKSVGRFFVKLNSVAPANTTVDGTVKDGAEPLSYVETPVSSEGGCTLYKLTAPSCINANSGNGCDTTTQVCSATDTCTNYPVKKNVGTVTVTGVETSAGTAPFTLTPVGNSYIVGGDVTTVYPGFTEGSPIKITAAGADYTAFEISAKGIKQLVLGASSYQVGTTTPLNVTWTAPGSASDARIQATVNLSHHGGSKGYIACDVADTGSLTISAAQIAGLINMGVAGFPTLTVIRRSTGTASVASGQVVLSVEASVSPDFSVEGFTSCGGDEAVTPCATGTTCNTAVKLCQ